jgi:hypothetical protein
MTADNNNRIIKFIEKSPSLSAQTAASEKDKITLQIKINKNKEMYRSIVSSLFLVYTYFGIINNIWIPLTGSIWTV